MWEGEQERNEGGGAGSLRETKPGARDGKVENCIGIPDTTDKRMTGKEADDQRHRGSLANQAIPGKQKGEFRGRPEGIERRGASLRRTSQ